jgi:hypothetical protein
VGQAVSSLLGCELGDFAWQAKNFVKNGNKFQNGTKKAWVGLL